MTKHTPYSAENRLKLRGLVDVGHFSIPVCSSIVNAWTISSMYAGSRSNKPCPFLQRFMMTAQFRQVRYGASVTGHSTLNDLMCA